MSYIKRFKEISSDDVSICGGKGASLGELMRAGFPFADGFVLTIDAFGIDQSQWAAEVHTAYDTLGTKYVAVRSSATKEDGVNDSFAGQFDTYLFVDKDMLIEKISECHASLQSDRIQSYCESKNIDRSEIKVAVVIQKMINSEVAGVVFTANPISSDTNEIIIEGGFGLGEAVVSGMITPDNYVWNKQKQSIIQKTIGQQHKKLMIDIDNGGIKEESIESTIQSIQKLSDAHITQLSLLSENIEKHYNKPMDIERALEDNTLYILQARPITTLDIVGEKQTLEDDKVQSTINRRSKKKYHYIHKRFRTPFYTYILWDAISTYHNKSISLDYACDIIYLDGHIAVDKNQRDIGKKQFLQMFLDDPTSINNLYNETYRIQSEIKKYYAIYLSPNKDIKKKDLIEFRKNYRSLMQKMLSTALVPLFIENRMEEKIKESLEKVYDEQQAQHYYQIATTSQKVGTAFKEEISLLDMAIARHSDKNIDAAMQQHIKEYGRTKNNSHDGSFKIQSDVIQQLDAIQDPSGRKEELQKYFQEVKSGLTTLREKFNEDKLFLDTLDTLQESIYFRSWRTERCYKNAYHIDRLFQQTAKYLGITDCKDVFYLTLPEIVEALESKSHSYENIDNRKDGYVTLGKSNDIVILQGDAILQEYSSIKVLPEKTSNIIQGQSAFKGQAQGRAVVVTHKDQLHKIQNGDILVTAATTVNYIPYLKKVQAIVADEGGVLSHASVISRELKIPTIIGTQNATMVIKDGDLVEVDATNGTVKIIEKTTDTMIARNWKKNWAGQWSLLSAAYFSRNYTVYLKKILGIGLEQTITITKSGTTYCYFDDDNKRAFGEYFARLAQQDETIIQQRCRDLIAQTDNILPLIDDLLTKPAEKNNFDIFIHAFDTYSVTHRIIKVGVDYLPPDMLPQHLPDLEKARLYAEPVYTRTEDYMQYVAQQLAQQYDISSKHILAMTKDQFELFLEKGMLPDIKILEHQYLYGMLYAQGETKTYYFGEEAQQYEQKIFKKLQDTSIITGQIAYAGKVTGTVKIVLDPKTETRKFEIGDILVTGMTRPEYLPLVEKCAAFVTDAGGILSHAAITARELKKPCIIGTQVATKLLKDGDVIEVNANTGQIKKIDYNV